MSNEIQSVLKIYAEKRTPIEERLRQINEELPVEKVLERKIDLLIEKDALKNELQKIADLEYGEVSKIRYIKGLQVLKILYEKILSLDHHFATVYTFAEINKISNP
ncbi:MAG: hypothetical protein LBE36_07655, partial [Flavobacteriaceae bacterium]|nr:hypothetical protein [Flavobacteriaceae bacterium]